MSIEEAVVYVAAAYAVIFAGVLGWAAVAAHRVGSLRRQVEALRRAVEGEVAHEPVVGDLQPTADDDS